MDKEGYIHLYYLFLHKGMHFMKKWNISISYYKLQQFKTINICVVHTQYAEFFHMHCSI